MGKKIIDSIYDNEGGFLSKYKAIQVGDSGWLTLIGFELATLLLRFLPGAPGLFLRSAIYPFFFASVGRGVVFGTGVTIRNPGRIRIGDHTIIDENATLDAKGGGEGKGITLGSRVFISRNALLGCKNGRITLGSGVTIGPNTIIHAIDASEVTIGDHTVIAANCYLIGAPNYRTERTDVPMAKQGFHEGKGIAVGSDVWLAAAVNVCDGARIGDGCIIGAMSLVRGEIPPYAKAHGIPARVTGTRSPTAAEATGGAAD
ncbi:MAG TPA: acyltransferase [Kiritimatiellia bacterium]|nr:acyltransferase [Kiritimatiellia bacterium]HMP33636.1 acyltransferase [Kiritimatiellia bacterium]